MEIEIEPNSQHVTWIVNDFLELPQKDDSYLDSPEFLFCGDRYCLRMYPRVNSSIGERTEFHVRRFSATLPKREVSCKIGTRVRNSTGEEISYYVSKALEENYWISRSWIEKKRDEYVPDGSFTILCCIRLSKDRRAGTSAQEEEGGFPGHNSSFSSRWSPQKMELSTHSPCTHVHLTLPKFPKPREKCDSLTSSEFRFAGNTYCVRFRANGDTGDTDLELVRLTSNFTERIVSYSVGYGGKERSLYSKNSRSLVGGVGLCITRSELEEKRKRYIRNDTLRLEIFLGLAEKNSS